MHPDPISPSIDIGGGGGIIMAPKRSVHIRKENVEIWGSLDSPSESVNNMLTDLRNSRPQGEQELKISKLRAKLAQVNAEVENYNQRINEIENDRLSIEDDLANALAASNFKINQKEFIATIFSKAEIACHLRREFGSVKTNTHWRFHSVGDGKIFITNLNTKRRPGFKQGVITGAIERLEIGQGKVKIGGLISVKWQEDALIALHPYLCVAGEWITYDPDFEPDEYIHCVRCGESDFKEIYGHQHGPYDEPNSLGHYCQQCGHLTDLRLDFPDIDEYYQGMAEEQMENRMDELRRGE